MPGPSREWWIGKTMECSKCGAKIELEEGDDKIKTIPNSIEDIDMPSFITVTYSQPEPAKFGEERDSQIVAKCPTRGCGETIVQSFFLRGV